MITRRADFLAANRGLRVARAGFVLLANPNGGRGKRYGVTVTKKIGNAVVRNRMKRRFRELLRAALPETGLPDHDHVLIGREGGIERDFASLREELAGALARAAAGEGDKPRRRNPPRHGEGGRARRGGRGSPPGAAVVAGPIDHTLRSDDKLPRTPHQDDSPLHHPSDGPPPRAGEEK